MGRLVALEDHKWGVCVLGLCSRVALWTRLWVLFECCGTRDDLGELGGDLGLTHTVELPFEQVGHFAGVVGGSFHRNHAGNVLGDDCIVEALEGDRFDRGGE